MVLPPQEDLPKYWLLFEGAVGGVHAYNGLLTGLFERYGTEGFKRLGVGFAGASSGAYSAGFALQSLYGPLDSRCFFEEHMLITWRSWQLLPLGMIFSVCFSIMESSKWTSSHCRKSPPFAEAMGQKKLFTWIVHPTLKGGKLDHWRALYDNNEEDFGDLFAGTSCMPLVTTPGLHWRCRGKLCQDGYLFHPLLEKSCMMDPKCFPGRSLSFATVPPRPGEERQPGMLRINIGDWVPLPLWDAFFMRLGYDNGAPRHMFEVGYQAAFTRAKELDAAVGEIFGLQPLDKEKR